MLPNKFCVVTLIAVDPFEDPTLLLVCKECGANKRYPSEMHLEEISEEFLRHQAREHGPRKVQW